MKCLIHQALIKPKPQRTEEGFTLVEVMVAGILLALVMGSVSRLGVSALASSANQSERIRIESAINNNIQLLQMEDSYLRLESLGDEEEQQVACADPIAKLSSHLSQAVPEPTAPGLSEPIERTFEPLGNSETDVLVVNYRFRSPESQDHKNSADRWEIRRVELNPNFTANCYTTVNS